MGKPSGTAPRLPKIRNKSKKTVVTNIQEREQEERILKEFDLNYQFGPCVGIGEDLL